MLAISASFGLNDKATTQASVHFGVYPGGVAQCLPLNLGCWGAGPSANSVAIQAEQSGVAAYTAAQWLTPDGVKQLNNIAELYAELCVHFGWPQPHWATDAEIQSCVAGSTSNGVGGATYHHDWTRNFPQDTTHTDPGVNYPGKADGPYTPGQVDPEDQFMPLAIAKWKALTGQSNTPTPPPSGVTPVTDAQMQTLLAAIAADRNNTQEQLRAQIAAEQGSLMADNRGQIAGLAAALNRFAAAILAAPGVKK